MSRNTFEVGEGVVEITPPLGIEMAGFHKPPGQERRITGIRRLTRALVMRLGRGGEFIAHNLNLSPDRNLDPSLS